METLRYTYRLRPGAKAEAALMAEWHRCRFLWNEAVHQQQIGNRPTLKTLGNMLTKSRARSKWLRDGSCEVERNVLRNYALALDQSFRQKNRNRPVFKPRKTTRPSLEYTSRSFNVRSGRLAVAKIAETIPVVWSRGLPSESNNVRIYQDSLGHWYASFVVQRETETAETSGRIGFDWGVATTATATDPTYDLPYQGHRKRCAAELAKAQRKMSRRRGAKGQPVSNGYKRARRQAAKVHKKAERQNSHASRVWAKGVVDNHQVIAVEDFKPKFLAKSTMARKAADAAIGAAKRELIERGTRAGRTVVMVPPAYTTMTCSECAAIAKRRLGLGERIFRCEHCGHTADRDRNAARVILNFATAERNRASADDVRHSETPLGEFASAV